MTSGRPDATDAAGAPAGRAPGDYAAARRDLLGQEGVPGADRRARLSSLTDAWLAGLLPDPVPDGVALVAVGGYGRGELSPRSDLDLLLLHDGDADGPVVAALADRIWYPVWDLGLALDHAVRTPAQARRTAAEDLKVHLGLLDARHIAGDAALTAALRTAVLADWRAQAARRLPELAELGRHRAHRHGELAHLLEPDLKEARGGLRDATVLRAVAASWLADAPRAGLDAARARLLDVRDALHLVTGRATDRLALQEQDEVAARLGLLDADTLLREVYRAARVIGYAAEVTWRETARVLRSRRARPRRLGIPLRGRGGAPGERTPLADGVVEHEGEAVLARTARPERDPVLPLRAAAAAAQADLPLSPHAVRALAATAPPLPVPWPAEAREALITLLGAGAAALPVWEALEAEDLVTRMLPDWARVRFRPQRNAVHRWTVDRHLVETCVRAAGLTRRVGRPDLLLTAALLHDIGKGWPGDHSVAGEVITRDTAARLGFGRQDVATLALLVRHHLLLAETATRRDLSDPATVEQVAGVVRDHGTLELLHALTEADALATGPAAWTSWRASLVADLVRRVAAVLAGAPAASSAPRQATAEEERLAVEAARTGGPVLTLRPEPEPGPAEARDDAEADDAGTEPVGVQLLMAVAGRDGLLPAAAGVLALHRLTVRAADLRTMDPVGTGPVTVLSWRVAAEYGALPEAARLRADLQRALDGSLDIGARLAEREAAYPRRRPAAAPPPRVTVAPGGSEVATVIEVRAHDAPGLLHRIGRALEAAGPVTVRAARISTLGADAVDAFYLVDADHGGPLADDRAARLAREVERALTVN
ncbi:MULTISPECIES: [protein-PII] uridylyltransferase [Streptomycetaceae]|uniref:Bifunctional uridylyltransferase/uridylyl-removing enzyme n=1 Tax=Streptantibioticus cattleyicolor (strain ATCC 35852 / DSM 46488 / JCM 4925 / NBRC 14057 / NRRL 8057) TaxID=1003195 RepID=F8JTM1_STREN|nr:[protein-PII] uridylyltransferase [Streptantibioticus cattleyicolor]AEW96788.1 PII uridylyl-transferase [Streptantibioticus cattleyicolor NRRL 8057 = DSM 46488]MYS61269.1 [protein-PII] uridylyltransferase [Streptomyces sp. SID5468]CCB77118.1 [Protein-PII] uridylyltransferase [Streptantibioticus cattleyicolor NRRL 8057 = DSM 46488]